MIYKILPILLISFLSLQINAMEILVNKPAGVPKGLVVIAPAKKYLMRERLFTKIAEELALNSFVVVRFNWSEDTLSDPNFELSRASNDIFKIVTEAQSKFNIPVEKTVLISKSFSTKALALSLKLTSANILLTPNCSDQAPFIDVYHFLFYQHEFKSSIFISNEDPYCEVKQVEDALSGHLNSTALFRTHGDHNFEINSGNRFFYQDQVIKNVITQANKFIK
jgi:hypothetical protein